jgi:NAD(P)H-dependent FMN reductase
MTQPQDRPMCLGVIIASTREGRFGPPVARWFAEQVHNAGTFDLDIIGHTSMETTTTPAPSRPR